MWTLEIAAWVLGLAGLALVLIGVLGGIGLERGLRTRDDEETRTREIEKERETRR